tara:strand:- start:278 stop:673 length:396 start_codon:yes stop_codon:yes gene_type:complete
MITLPRTGLAPLVFSGSLLAAAGDRPNVKTSWAVRWHSGQLYRADLGAFVLLLKFNTEQKDEFDRETVLTASDLAGILDLVKKYDPVRWLDDYPAHARWDARREKRNRQIQAQLDEVIEELMSQAGLTETL